MNFRFILALLLLSICLLGCSEQAVLEKMLSDEDRRTADYYVDLLQKKDSRTLDQAFPPEIRAKHTKPQFDQMVALLPNTPALGKKLVGVHVLHTPDSVRSNIVYECQYPQGWFLITLWTERKGSQTALMQMGVNPLPDSLENLNRFTLSAKSPVQYVFLVAAVFIPLLIIYALICCVRTRMRRKWLWIIFILFGVGQLSVNWSTGHLSIMPLSFQLLGVGAFAQLYGPWVISISLPLGAILFLWRRKDIQALCEN